MLFFGRKDTAILFWYARSDYIILNFGKALGCGFF